MIALALGTADLRASERFFRALLGVVPTLVSDELIRFEPSQPPLMLELVPGTRSRELNHAGLRLPDSAALVPVQLRLELAGFRTTREDGVECCHSMQAKFWATDPDGTSWEIYTLLAPERPKPAPTPVIIGEVADVIYLGPFQSVEDDAGTVYPRGERVRVKAEIAAMLKTMTGSDFAFLE